MSPSLTLSQLIQAGLSNQNCISQNFAIATIVICEYLHFFPEEVHYIWRSNWNIGKVLFLIIRYQIFADVTLSLVASLYDLSPSACGRIIAAQEWLFVTGIGFVAIMLSLRTWIIWMRNKKIAYLLGALFTLFWGTMFGFSFRILDKYQHESNPIFSRGCYNGVKRLRSVGILVIVSLMAGYEAILIVITWIRIIKDRRLGFVKTQSPVISFLYRDVLLNKVFILIVSTAIQIPFESAQQTETSLVWQRLIHGILGTRILLHLRMASEGHAEYLETPCVIQAISKLVLHLATPKKSRQSFGAELQDWFAPDPEIYPSHIQTQRMLNGAVVGLEFAVRDLDGSDMEGTGNGTGNGSDNTSHFELAIPPTEPYVGV